MANIDFGNQCAKASKEYNKDKDISENELFLEVDDEYVYVNYSNRLDIQAELYEMSKLIDRELYSYRNGGLSTHIYNEETRKYNLDASELTSYLRLIKDEHEDKTREDAFKLFENTGFFKDNDEHELWTEEYTYSVMYKLSLNHPGFKNSLRLLMNRFGINIYNIKHI